jgi:hypothetical protein
MKEVGDDDTLSSNRRTFECGRLACAIAEEVKTSFERSVRRRITTVFSTDKSTTERELLRKI